MDCGAGSRGQVLVDCGHKRTAVHGQLGTTHMNRNDPLEVALVE